MQRNRKRKKKSAAYRGSKGKSQAYRSPGRKGNNNAYRSARKKGTNTGHRSSNRSRNRTGSSYKGGYSPQQRRRKNQIRRRRNRMRRGLMAGIGVICLIGVICMLVNSRQEDNWKQDDTQSQVSMADQIALHKNDYPESLQKLLARNPETIQFVYDYPWEKNKTHAIDLSGEVTKGTIPSFLQWDERWGYQTYGSDMIAITGCGPTCLSMVACGVTGNTAWSPLRVAQYAEENGYYAEGSGTAWTMMTKGAAELGLQAKELALSDSLIRQTLKAGKPIICSMGAGDFTSSGHFIVLAGINQDGTIQVHDPNSRKNTKKKWNLQRLMNQMQNLWTYTEAQTE